MLFSCLLALVIQISSVCAAYQPGMFVCMYVCIITVDICMYVRTYVCKYSMHVCFPRSSTSRSLIFVRS